MANWVAATDTNGKQVYVNIGTAMTLRQHDSSTRITWAGGDDDKIRVRETPEELLGAAGMFPVATR